MKLFKKVMFFLVFEFIFCTAFGTYLVFYGPFKNIRNTIVTSAMTTMNHKYIAKLFLNDNEINKIMDENKVDSPTESENEDAIEVKYSSNNVECINIESSRYKGYLLIVDNPRRVRIGTSSDLGKRGETLGQILKRYNAAAGINAGGFSNAMTGTGGIPSGIIIEDGRIKFIDDEKTFNIVGFNNKDVLIVGQYKYDEIENLKLRDAISFGPALIVNGKPMIKKGDGGWGIAPRTAIGQTQDGKVLLLTIDGRQKDSLGATLKDVQDILLEYGAYNASNLDGGSSATMYNDGKLVNKPSDILGERAIPSAFIVE
ncbi:Exopolysaccharide biosynthesis protein [Caloramator quimbayensis]|uniref:Exopolysaccharide biosynthesis protein n=1 Tax=Caloramator quimbayensis TaxID=1147123 RepID=A0A1T4WQY7_9CLOT|nr:phosphodiester glycosidase family protein [Caloramator quimbayensis]SKA79774.1 Exopolysaccharide biosynthesis protein [Caloramator quimbayensis]